MVGISARRNDPQRPAFGGSGGGPAPLGTPPERPEVLERKAGAGKLFVKLRRWRSQDKLDEHLGEHLGEIRIEVNVLECFGHLSS